MSKTENPVKTNVDDKILWNIIGGVLGYPAVLVAYELKLFPLLHKEPLALEEICNTLETDARATEALLAVNISLGLITEDSEKYSITPTSECYLLEESPTYMGCLLDLLLANSADLTAESLKKAMKTGKAQVYGGEDIFESHAAQEDQARAFTRAMHSASVGPAMHWPKCIDLSSNKHILDIGGGSGAHAIGAVNQWPHLQGTVFDLPPVCKVANEIINECNLQEQITSHHGDLWNGSLPEADIHFYSQIYHDWPENKCRYLTQKSFDALPSDGRIIIHEMLINDDKSGPMIAAAGCVAMLLWTEGKQYSALELTQMLSNAGFIDIEIKPTYSYWSIVTGRKP